MGKLIVLTGPRSSGKTTLMHALIRSKVMNLATIPGVVAQIDN